MRQLKGALNRLGYYQPFNKVGMIGMPDAALFDALIKFQSDSGLSPQGELRPDDDTVKAINQKLKEEPKDGYYIWRTVADDKVRSAHKALNGTIRKWSDSPDPTEEYNCRCWAEPIDPSLIPELTSLKVDTGDLFGNPSFDSINPTISPFDLLSGGVAKGGQIAVKQVLTRLININKSKNIHFEKKILDKMKKRGWTKETLEKTISRPHDVKKVRDIRHRNDGTRNDDPATAYIDRDGHYIVRNDKTGDIVQISDKNKPGWKKPF